MSGQGSQAQAPRATQSADPFADIYGKLDEQLALGMGRIGARRRSTDGPKVQAAEPEGDAHYVPRTREAYRRELDQRFERAIAANAAAEQKRRDAFNADIEAECGPGQLTGAQLGMSVARFEACGQEIRFGGGLTHVISLRQRGLDARLYVFSESNAHKVYAVDQRITRIEQRPWRMPPVTLPRIGAYPQSVGNPLIVALSEGNLFGYGETYGEDWDEPAGANLLKWADKFQRINNSQAAPPFMWDASKQGWLRLPPPPACAGLWHQHTLTALADDRVLVAGGLCDIPRLSNEMGVFEPQARTALWDARQRVWLDSPNLKQARIYHTATALEGQRVMLVGGLDDPLTVAELTAENPQPNDVVAPSTKVARVLDSVEILADAQWRSLPALLTARAKHTATLLPDGRLLVVGGLGKSLQALAKVELWDPVQQQWLARAPMSSARYGHTSILLADGRVLVSGGIDDQESVLNTTELYDPATNTWSAGPPLPEHLQGHAALRLPDGRILLAGGWTSPSADGPWLISWHPGVKIWHDEGRLEAGRSGQRTHRPALLPLQSGQVLLFSSQDVYLYRPPEASPGSGAQPPQAPGTAASALPFFPSEWWKAPPPAPVVKAAPPQALGQPGRLARVGQDLWAARATLGQLAAGLLVLGLLGHWWKQRRRAALTDNARPQEEAPSSQRSGKGWVVRVLVYGALLVVAGPNLIAYWRLRTIDVEDGCRARPAACLDPGTGLLARQSAVPERSSLANPRIPCPFVGSWVTRRGNSEFHIDLHADGRYHMPASSYEMPDDGYWAVQGKYMLWRSSTHQFAEMDINRIVSNDGQHFELIESNGLHSHFDHEADLPGQRCEP